MDKWQVFVKDLITLGMFMFTPAALVWRGIIAWEKRKTASIKPVEEKIDKNKEEIDKLKDVCKEHAEEIRGIKSNVNEITNRVWNFLTK